MVKIRGTCKFGKKRYTLKWDSATFTTYHNPDSAAGIAEKRRMAKVWAKDYTNDDWTAEITTYNHSKDFKVWALPK